MIYNILECVCWKSHVIRHRRGGISGIPEELYNIPALYGMIYNSYYNFSIIIHSTSGYEECGSTFNDQDLHFCQQYSSVKPAPAGIEFLELVYTYYCMKMAGTCQTIVKNHDH